MTKFLGNFLKFSKIFFNQLIINRLIFEACQKVFQNDNIINVQVAIYKQLAQKNGHPGGTAIFFKFFPKNGYSSVPACAALTISSFAVM